MKKSIFIAEEDAVIIEEVKKLPSNLSKAFIAASARIDKAPMQIQSRWYSRLRKTGPIFGLDSGVNGVINGKNHPVGERSTAPAVINLSSAGSVGNFFRRLLRL